MKEPSEIICNIEELKNKELFKNVKYYIIGKTHDQLRKLLAEGGAKESNYLTQLVTLAIADDPSHSDVEEASDIFDLPVVTSRWVLLSAKCGVLLPKNGFQPGVSQLFSGVCVCPSQVGQKDNSVLWGMITYLGGRYNLTLDGTCTHLVTTKAGGAKYNHALKVGCGRVKIVTLDWIYDSVKGKKRLDEAKYHPRLLVVPSPIYAATSLENRPILEVPSAAEDSPLETLLLPENVALQLESLLDDVVSGSSIGLPLQLSTNPPPSRKGPAILSPSSSSNIDGAVKLSTASLAVITNNESESAPLLQMKSSQWMTQQVQGVFNQQQQSLSPASNLSPSFSQANTVSNNLWVTSVEGQMKDVQIASNKVQQVVRVAVPPQFMVRQQQPQQQSILQQQQQQQQHSQMTWQAQQQQQQQQAPPQQMQQLQQQQQQPQQIQTLRSGAQQQPPQQLMMRPQGIAWSQGQNVSGQMLQPRIVQMVPQQRAQVLAMQQQQQQQASQHHLQQRPMQYIQRPGIPPRDSAPQFIGQPQTGQTMVRSVMVQRAAVPGSVQQGTTTFWYQRGQHPQQGARVAWQQQVQIQQPIQQQMQSSQLQQQIQQQSPQLQQQIQQQSSQLQQQSPQLQQQIQQQSSQLQQQIQQQSSQLPQQIQQQSSQLQQQIQQQSSQLQQQAPQLQQQTSQLQQQIQQQSPQLQQQIQQQSPQLQQQIQQQSPQLQQQIQQQSPQLQQQIQQQSPQFQQQIQQKSSQLQQQIQQSPQLQQQIQQQIQLQHQVQAQLQAQGAPRPPNGAQIHREGIQLTPQRFSIPVQQHQQGNGVPMQQDRPQLHILQSQQQQQQQQFVRESNSQQIIIQREGGPHPESIHPSQIRQQAPPAQQLQAAQAANITQRINVVPQSVLQAQQQHAQIIQQQQQLGQPMPQLKLRDAVSAGVAPPTSGTPVTPVSTPSGTPTSNWPPPSPQVKQMLSQQQQLQQQAQRQLHPVQLQILQQQRASSQMRPALIQQQVQQRPLGHIQGQSIQRTIIPQRVAVTGFNVQNVQRFHAAEAAINPQVHPQSGVTVVTAGPGHEQPSSPQQPGQSPMPVQQQQTQTPLSRDSLHQVVQQGQEQIQQQLQNLANLNQPQQVTPKTKTALANLLNNRLHISPRPNETEIVAQPAVARFPGPVIQHQQPQMSQPPREALAVDHQRTLRNITNSGNTTVMVRAAVGPKQGGPRFTPPSQLPPQPGVPRVQYYGHEPNVKVPPDLCLIGCFFSVVDYDTALEPEKFKIWIKVIEQYGGEVDSNYGPRITHILCDNQKNPIVQQGMREGRRCVTASWLNDVIAAKRMLPPWSPLHYPTPFSDDKPCKSQIISVSGFEGEDRQRLKTMILLTGAKYTGYFSRSNTLLICQKNEGIKYKSAKEWKIPCVNVEWLQDVLYGHYDALRIISAQKYVQFNSEDPFKVDYLLVPHLMAAWRIPVRITDETWKKHLPNSAALTTLIQERAKRKQEAAERKVKRLRLSPTLEENIPITTQFPPAKENRPVVLFTGIKGTSELSRKVLEMGGLVAKHYKECTHLVTDNICRTVKFMCALNICKHVVSKSWILESAKENRFIDEKPHVLQDAPNELHFGCYIQDIISRIDRKPIFKELTFFITPSVKPNSSVVREVIEAAGGTVVPKCPPFKDIIAANKNSPSFVVITCKNDSHLCREMFKRNIGVYNEEFVFTSVMRQELEFKPFIFTVT